MALDLVVCGALGRMGRTLGRLIAQAEDLRALGGIDRASSSGRDAEEAGYPEVATMEEAGALLARADVVLDFSAPDALRALLDRHGAALAGKALVVGTTGLGEAAEAALERVAGTAAVLVAANFSPGVNLLLALSEQAARALPADAYDVEIVEAHHRRKADAPSGTALALARSIAEARGQRLEDVRRDGRSGRGERLPGEIGLHALRGGDVTGEHRVHFLAGRERIELAHSAASRDLFAEGALRAARWVAEREPGRYGMRQVLGL